MIEPAPEPDPDALLAALVLAPELYARNRFFELFQKDLCRRVRRRASVVRGVIRQLIGVEHRGAEVKGEQVQRSGRVLLCYVVPSLGYTRTVALTELEDALVRFAVARATQKPVPEAARGRIEESLRKLYPGLPEPPLP